MAPSKTTARGKRKGAGQAARTVRSLIAICTLGVVLALYNAISLHRDVGLAIGPAGPAQEQFFRDASDRPDISTFFKNLRPDRRLIMARNIGRYTDAELAQLCGKCLDTFDPVARAALTKSLSGVAKVHPDAVAALLKLPGSFQQISIATALRSAGPAALPLVAKQFSDADARPNAVAYLVAAGPDAIVAAMPYLASKDKDIRLAAADTLGKLRAKQAVEPLTKLFDSSKEDERLSYLTALAGIGEPASEGLMATTLDDLTLPTPHRAQAALGLGVIGTKSALAKLWHYSTDVDKYLRESVISALQIDGDPALRLAAGAVKTPVQMEAVIRVAGGVRSAFANSILEEALVDPATAAPAAEVAGRRPELVPILVAHVRRLDAATEGDQVDAILQTLATTPEGRAALSKMSAGPDTSALGALAARRLGTLRS